MALTAMDPGQLRHAVAIEADTGEIVNAMGQKVRDWRPIAGGAKVWAKIEPLSMRELQLAQQTTAITTHRITTRYLADVSPRMRVKFGERVFFIEGVRNLEERNVYLELIVREDA